MKKVRAILLCAFMFLGVFGVPAQAKVGDVIGKAINTDIVAYINHYAIPSYAVNGQSVIVAEDLRNFGFDVTWNQGDRTLTISRNDITQPYQMDFNKQGAPNTKFADTLETDIRVYAGGVQLTSYAMSGYTMIPIEELTMFGQVNWVQSERAIKLWVDNLHVRSAMQAVEAYVPNAGTSSVKYYPGTIIPDYASVTGAALNSSVSVVRENGAFLVYDNRWRDGKLEVLNYIEYVYNNGNNGWRFFYEITGVGSYFVKLQKGSTTMEILFKTTGENVVIRY